MITASAPGKLMLFGEHAAVYGYPCIVTAVGERMTVAIEKTEDGIIIDAPQVKNTVFVENAIDAVSSTFHIRHTGLHITTSCMFSCKYGFGSSSAVTVAAIYALTSLFQKKIDKKQIFTLAYKTVLDVQKIGSGFDVAAATYGGTLFYGNKGETIESLKINNIPIIIGYSQVKADTVALIEEVRRKKEKEPEKVERIFQGISKIIPEARQKIEEGDWERVGTLMNFNQEYLRDLGVSTEKLEAMISASKKAGAWGAKLSGAGGGDCMIALTPNDKRKAVSDAITAAGGEVVDVSVNSEGVKIENSP
jgi:mevalonate kinase